MDSSEVGVISTLAGTLTSGKFDQRSSMRVEDSEIWRVQLIAEAMPVRGMLVGKM
jgi:hypothetical protein